MRDSIAVGFTRSGDAPRPAMRQKFVHPADVSQLERAAGSMIAVALGAIMKSGFVVCALMAAVLMPVAANASGVGAPPAATYNGYFTENGVNTAVSGAGTYGGSLTTLSMGGMPSDFASVSAMGAGGNGGFAVAASGTPTYFGVLNGPGVGLVPLKLIVNMSAFAHDVASSMAQVKIFVSGNSTAFHQVLAVSGGGPDVEDTFFGAMNFFARPGELLRFDLRAEADTSNRGFSRASVDPLLIVDPNFGAAGDYSFTFSPGVGNAVTGGAPEPASWGLMLVGFGGLGSALRHRRRVALVA